MGTCGTDWLADTGGQDWELVVCKPVLTGAAHDRRRRGAHRPAYRVRLPGAIRAPVRRTPGHRRAKPTRAADRSRLQAELQRARQVLDAIDTAARDYEEDR